MSSSGRESREGDSEVSGGRRHKKRRSEDRSSRSGGTGAALGLGASGGVGNSVSNYLWSFLGKFNPYASTAPRPPPEKPPPKKKVVDTPEEAEKRRLDIEKNRGERMRRRKQERMLQTERFIKSMRLLHLNDRGALHQMQAEGEEEATERGRRRRRKSKVEGEEDDDMVGSGGEEEDGIEDDDDENWEGVDGDEQYSDFSLHLYRKTMPIFQERLKTIEQKLAVSQTEIDVWCVRWKNK